MANDPPPLSVDEAARILARLEDLVGEKSVVLVGGQTLVVWATQLEDYLHEALADQISSRDVDFLGGAADVQRAAKLLDGTLASSDGWKDRRNPLSGVTTFVDSANNERRLDFLDRVHGLTADEIRETAIEVQIDVDGRTISLWVLHPHLCLKSRVCNTELPNKQTDLAYRQIKAAVKLARAFSALLLATLGAEGVKDVMALNERVFAVACSTSGIRVYKEHGIDVLEALSEDETLPVMHRTRRLPQMREQAARRRGVATSERAIWRRPIPGQPRRPA